MSAPLTPEQRTETPQGCCVIGRYCQRHGFIHGAEAEELRERFEKLADEDGNMDIQAVLDEVDARDSCAYLEAVDENDDTPAAPPPAVAPAALVAIVERWQKARRAVRDAEDHDALGMAEQVLDVHENALLSWTPDAAAPPVAAPAEGKRAVPTCVEHGVRACVVCLTDEWVASWSAPAARPAVEVGDIVQAAPTWWDRVHAVSPDGVWIRGTHVPFEELLAIYRTPFWRREG